MHAPLPAKSEHESSLNFVFWTLLLSVAALLLPMAICGYVPTCSGDKGLPSQAPASCFGYEMQIDISHSTVSAWGQFS